MKRIFIQSCFIILCFICCDKEHIESKGTRQLEFDVTLTNKTTDSLNLIFWCTGSFNFKYSDTIKFNSNESNKFKTFITYPGQYNYNYVFNENTIPNSNKYEIYSFDRTLLVGLVFYYLDSVNFVFNNKKVISFNVNAQTNNTRQLSNFIVADKPYTNLFFMNKLATQNLVFPQKLLDSARNIN